MPLQTIRRSAATVSMLVALALSPVSASAAALPLEVAHFWVAPSENKALDVFRHAWSALGGQWIDTTAPNRTAQLKMVMDRIANGYAPTVIQWNANEASKELPEMGVIQDIEEVAKADRWKEFLPAAILDAITYKGRIFLAPTNIHAENWLWTNRRIFDQLALKLPTTWDEVLGHAEKIAAAGYQPIAMGTGPWEVSLIFNDIIYATYGRDDYIRLMRAADPQMVMDPRMTRALELLRRLRTFVSTDRADKTWAGATRAVGAGRAAMQFMGDWAKGELAGAGLLLDKDFQCSLAPGTADSYFLIVDAFAFPLTTRAEERQAQVLFARQVMDVRNQIDFSTVKGAISVRTDVPRHDLDSCARIGLDRIAQPGFHVPAQSMAMPTHMSEGWIVTIANYFNDPSISPEAVQKELFEILSQK